MSRAENKADRLIKMEALLLAHPEGMTQSELARHLGVDRSVIHRNLYDFQKIYPTIVHEDGRISLDRSAYLVKVAFTLHEATAVHIAARLMATRMDRQNPHAASALRKLGVALEKLAPRISSHVKQAADVVDDASQWQDPRYLDVLEGLTLAWAEQRKVKVKHRSDRTGKVLEYLLCPYFIEPYAVGQTTHLIARDESTGKMRTLKIERIEKVELTQERYDIPADFDPRDLLADAWGIWYTESNPVEVTLKFSRNVASRLKETRWHRSQQPLEEMPDGGIIWRAKVAEPQEMIPWIRAWGADCEVVEPKGLRESLKKEVMNMSEMYQVSGAAQIPLHQILWAKTTKDKTATHPLICHMIDVAMCASVLWNESLPKGTQVYLASFLGMESNLEDAGRILSFWAGLHDLGKASPCFQMKHHPTRLMEEKKGLTFSRLDGTEKCLHGHISTRTLKPLLERETGLTKIWADKVAQALGGHHGEWPTQISNFANDTLAGKRDWDKIRRVIFLRVKEIIAPPFFSPPELKTVESNAFFALFSGFVSVADWLGSMEDYFQPQQGVLDLEKYAEYAKGQARKALQENGWLGWNPPSLPITIAELCAIPAARPLQAAVVDLSKKLAKPELVLIEAPTGEGKTEAAVYLADAWTLTLQQRGAYIAMPTMATSNQMHGRITKILKRRYQDERFLSFHLLHGNAALQENDQVPALLKINEKSGNLGAASWFTKRKRGLLAPFAVGTVDQALLSALQTPHFFVRLFGLSGKTVIFDEVHAYDTYMDELFFHLLRWLKVIGASVVILSATLPEATRRNILQAYTGKTMENLPAAPYPSVTWTNEDNVPETVTFPASAPRTLQIEQIDQDPQKISDILEKELENGGYAAVICNTVARAQKVYLVLKERNLVPIEDLHLFHARFPFGWRQGIEKTVTDIFDNHAPENEPRRKQIVVATQVIEQSLDLDFDLMISDLAPIDLLLQRAGRLHRNPLRQNRPEHLQYPRLLVAVPELENGVPKFSRGDTFVYEEYILLRSYRALTDKIKIPEDTRALLQSVYGLEERFAAQLSPDFQQALNASREKMEKTRQENWLKARQKLIQPPDSADLLTSPITRLDEDNPELHSFMRAATRLALPSVTLICLHKTPDGHLALDPESDSALIDLETAPDFAQARLLMARKVEVTNYELVKYFSAQQPPQSWKESTWLRYARCIEFEKVEGLDGSIFQVPEKSWKLILDHKLGLVFDKGE